MTLELALLPIAAALLPRQLEYECKREAEALELRLIDDGLCGHVIDADGFVAWRRLLMPSTLKH